MGAIQLLYPDNANGFRVRGLWRNALENPGYVNTALVTVRVQDMLGVDVPTTLTTWPLTLPYIAGSNGDYEEIMGAGDLVVQDYVTYQILYTIADVSLGQSGPLRQRALAQTRYIG